MVERHTVNVDVAGSIPALRATPAREWLDQADDPAVRAWLHIRNGPNALTNQINYLRVKNTVYSLEGQEVLEALLSSVARAAFELGRL